MIDHGFRVMLGQDAARFPVIPVGYQQRRGRDGRTETDLLYRFADFRGMTADSADTKTRLSRCGHWLRLPPDERHTAATE